MDEERRYVVGALLAADRFARRYSIRGCFGCGYTIVHTHRYTAGAAVGIRRGEDMLAALVFVADEDADLATLAAHPPSCTIACGGELCMSLAATSNPRVWVWMLQPEVAVHFTWNCSWPVFQAGCSGVILLIKVLIRDPAIRDALHGPLILPQMKQLTRVRLGGGHDVREPWRFNDVIPTDRVIDFPVPILLWCLSDTPPLVFPDPLSADAEPLDCFLRNVLQAAE